MLCVERNVDYFDDMRHGVVMENSSHSQGDTMAHGASLKRSTSTDAIQATPINWRPQRHYSVDHGGSARHTIPQTRRYHRRTSAFYSNNLSASQPNCHTNGSQSGSSSFSSQLSSHSTYQSSSSAQSTPSGSPSLLRRNSDDVFVFDRVTQSRTNSQQSKDGHSSWTEYTARKAVVRFRTRRSAKGRRRYNSPYTPPSRLVSKVLHNQYDIARREDTRMVDKVMAVFYCWYFGWISDIYNVFTASSTRFAFFKWILSCVLVTGATLLVLVLLTAAMFVALQFLLSVLEASLWFGLTVSSVFVCLLAAIAIFNFD